ncbi:MAG: ABC transporter permease [Candidatus Aenigmarchaeota archaeon]|nr:ABC transporter permease [Candidatus Aenigmarchaeota archaeon]
MNLISLTFSSIRQRRTRSWLTVTGIVIGIAAVISLVSITMGMQSAIVGQLQTFGLDKIGVMPGSSFIEGGAPEAAMQRGTTQLSKDDVEVVKKVNGIDSVTAFYSQGADVTFGRQTKRLTVMGLDMNIEDVISNVQGLEIKYGRELRKGDSGKAIIGGTIAKEAFEKEVRLGTKFTIEGKKFEIIGILTQSGDPSADRTVMMPIDEVRNLFGVGEAISFIWSKVSTNRNNIDVAKAVEKKLEDHRGRKDFSVITPQQAVERIGSVLGILQIVLVGVASISLIVGGVGIMNTMYTSVLERTKEIGVMKAVGATNSDIMKIFVLESGIIGVVGGSIGIILGVIIAKAIEAIAANAGFSILKAYLSPDLIVFGFAFSLFIGILSGILPARRASRLDPVDAMRYE